MIKKVVTPLSNKRPSVSLSNGVFSLSCLLFKASEDLSSWTRKSGIYAYTRLEQGSPNGHEGNNKPYLKIIYIGCTLDFSHIKYTAGTAITRHNPTHICFYHNKDESGMKHITESLIDYYKPIAMDGESETSVVLSED